MHPVHHDVDMKVIRIRVRRNEVLMFFEAQRLDGLFRRRLPLLGRGPLPFLPAQLVVVHGVFHAQVLARHGAHLRLGRLLRQQVL